MSAVPGVRLPCYLSSFMTRDDDQASVKSLRFAAVEAQMVAEIARIHAEIAESDATQAEFKADLGRTVEL